MKSPVCKRILYVIGGLLILFLITGGVIWRFYPLLLPSLEVKQSEAATELFAMDTYSSMTAYGPDAEGALTEASNEIRKIEQLLSVTNPDSDIHAVNHSGGQPVMVSRETAEIVSFALQMAEETNGALEPAVYPVLTAWGFTTDENRVPADDEIRLLLEHWNCMYDCGKIMTLNNSTDRELTVCKSFLTAFLKVCQSLLIDDFL